MTHGQCCIPSKPTPRVAGTAPLTAAIGQALISCHPGHRHQPSSCSRPVGRPVSYRRSSRQDEVTLRADLAVDAEADLGTTGGAYFLQPRRLEREVAQTRWTARTRRVRIPKPRAETSTSQSMSPKSSCNAEPPKDSNVPWSMPRSIVRPT